MIPNPTRPRFSKSSALKSLIPVLALVLAGCGERDFSRAEKRERLGRFPSAISKYQNFARNFPRHPRAPEALFRAGEIYRRVVKDYPKAHLFYEKILQAYPGSPWAAKAERSLLDAPDYFPFWAGYRRTWGDSQSGGRHMRTLETVAPVQDNPDRILLKKEIYAGDSRVAASELIYEKKDRELREFPFSSAGFTTVLRYPLRPGQKWESLRGGRRVYFDVEEIDAAVEIKAGVFVRCAKIRERAEASGRTWKTVYYVPDVGPVLACAATENGETRIMELIAKPDRPRDAGPPDPGSAPLSPPDSATRAEPSLFEKARHWIQGKLGRKNP